MEHSWYRMPANRVLQKLNTNPQGLSERAALHRRARFGPNALPAARSSPAIMVLFRQLQGPLVLVLVVAAFVSVLLGDLVDAAVILAAVLVNVLVGFAQEYRAERSLAALRNAEAASAFVVRDGVERVIPAASLVPGDILIVRAGNRIAADARLFQAADLQVHEAALTGESYAVAKHPRAIARPVPLADRANMLFAGTTVLQGTAQAAVTATGRATEVGAIAASLGNVTDDATPLQQQLRRLSGTLSRVMLFAAFAVFALGLLAGRPLVNIFTVAVALAVAAIPEGLLVSVTAILAVATRRMLRQHALIRRLIAAETLGATRVICTDKTGTLTEGDMVVTRLLTDRHDLGLHTRRFAKSDRDLAGSSALHALEIGILCNDAVIENEAAEVGKRIVIGGPTDRALVHAAHAVGLLRGDLERAYPRLAALPFDSKKKFTATLHRLHAGGGILFVKGAPERVLAHCALFDQERTAVPMSAERRTAILAQAARFAARGLRTLAFAYRPSRADPAVVQKALPDDLVFVGLMCLQDPLRAEARATVHACTRAGMTTVMITGDHPLTARHIARELGLPAAQENVLTGEALDVLSDEALARRVQRIAVYARVTPQHKLRIVDAWQSRGVVVAMTGDGVNDAPALRSANIGIALGSGTDVAKEAADMVLLDNNFRTIVTAVEQGRILYENTRKVMLFLLADSFAAVGVVGCSLLLSFFVPDFPLPLLAAQILWVNLVTDSLPNIALTVEPSESGIMQEPPRLPAAPLLTHAMRMVVALVSTLTAAITLALFLVSWYGTNDLTYARTFAFAVLGCTTLFSVFSIRSLRRPLLAIHPFANRLLVLCVCLGLTLQVLAVSWPPLQALLGTVTLSLRDWAVVACAGLALVLVLEIAKAHVLPHMERQRPRRVRVVQRPMSVRAQKKKAR